jgi:hypothetical protein
LQCGLAVIRSQSLKAATVIRWVSVLIIAVGLGIAVAHSATLIPTNPFPSPPQKQRLDAMRGLTEAPRDDVCASELSNLLWAGQFRDN